MTVLRAFLYLTSTGLSLCELECLEKAHLTLWVASEKLLGPLHSNLQRQMSGEVMEHEV